jgi:tRNA A58 N-methylase Trm61
MTFMQCSRFTSALLLVTVLVPGTAAAQGSGPISNAQILDSLSVREGATICEMGAGDGELTLAAARLVGSQGRVYASELGDDRVKTLRAKVGDSTLAPITVVAGDP